MLFLNICLPTRPCDQTVADIDAAIYTIQHIQSVPITSVTVQRTIYCNIWLVARQHGDSKYLVHIQGPDQLIAVQNNALQYRVVCH